MLISYVPVRCPRVRAAARSKEGKRSPITIDHVFCRRRILRADECFDMAKVLSRVIGDADLHRDRPKISLTSRSVANSP